MSYLLQHWHQLTQENPLHKEYWEELVAHYQEKHRHYHTLAHLEYMLQLGEQHRASFENWEAFVAAVFYHDIIYNPKRKDNEAKSAALAMARLQKMGFSVGNTQRIDAHIRATQGHETHEDPDTNLLLDIDLGILGEGRERYVEYTQQVRQEYRIYPAPLYRQGRRKVLKHFLGMLRIYKTEAFLESHENQARANLAWELGVLRK
ncbi:MAG TPA: hypothetical protein DCE41_11630 [Cytophagales bacterium]|nr:hypothetical protein [Cytophagales bacterium]HAA17495.1 hypothetical protein [Cytophagales bacterium]HAP61069.1 hypothetical protein [Cytophagales bacterium]